MTIRFKAPLFGSKSAVGRLMDRLKNETSGLAIDFTSDQMLIRDTTTPSNIYFGSPTDKLTYTSPSVKLTRQSDGVYRYQAHNLFLNSAAPANQSITVVSGATYAITITGSVTTTLSGAATGTITAGTTNITAGSTTLTFGSTSGSGTVHVRRTPSNDTYLATAGTARFALPYEWDESGNPLGILVEEARTNLSTQLISTWDPSGNGPGQSRTNGFAPGPNGVAGQACRIQLDKTGGSFSRYIAAYTVTDGQTYTGSVWMRTNGSGTSLVGFQSGDASGPGTLCTVTPEWQRFSCTRTNVGTTCFQQIILFDGYGTDETCDIVVWVQGQLELGSVATSPIETFGATVTRAADNISLATSAFPYNGTEVTGFVQASRFQPAGYSTVLMLRGTSTTLQNRFDLGMGQGGSGTSGSFRFDVVSSNVIQAPLGSSIPFIQNTKYKGAFAAKENDFAFAANGNTPDTDTSGLMPIGIDRLEIGNRALSNHLNGHIQQIMILPRRITNAELQALTA